MLYVKLFISFFIIGMAAFGGGMVTISLIEREIVIKHQWLTESQFADIVSISQMTPGPIGLNSATFTGFKVGGFLGSIVATLGIVLPAMVLITILLYLFNLSKKNDFIIKIRRGFRPGVIALIIMAVFSVGRITIKDYITLSIAVITFILMTVFKEKVHPVVYLLIGGIVGILVLR